MDSWEGSINGDYKCVSENELELTTNQSGLGVDIAQRIAGINEFTLDGDTLEFPSMGLGYAIDTYHRVDD